MISGCSSYRYGVLPGAAKSPDADQQVVTLHSDVRVMLRDQSEVSGKVSRVSESELVLTKAGNYGVEELVIPAADIEFILVSYLSSGDKVAMYSLVGLVALVVVGAVAISEGFDGAQLD